MFLELVSKVPAPPLETTTNDAVLWIGSVGTLVLSLLFFLCVGMRDYEGMMREAEEEIKLAKEARGEGTDREGLRRRHRGRGRLLYEVESPRSSQDDDDADDFVRPDSPQSPNTETEPGASPLAPLKFGSPAPDIDRDVSDNSEDQKEHDRKYSEGETAPQDSPRGPVAPSSEGSSPVPAEDEK